MKDLATQGIRNGESVAIQLCSRRNGRDGGNVTGSATDLGKDLLTGLCIRSWKQSGIDWRSFGGPHESGKLVDVVVDVFGISGCLAKLRGVGEVEPAGDALFVNISIS